MATSKWVVGAGWLAAFSIALVATDQTDRPSRPPSSPVTFAEHIAPLVFDNCTVCHRPGEAAPFSLMTYEDVSRRGRLIAAVTKAKVMPPWKAAPSSYPFRDDRGLTSEEIALIQSWVDQGMPQGDLAKVPSLPRFSSGWQLGEPDLVIEMPAGYRVPADGPDVYRNFALPLGIAEDRWIRAIELRPSARTGRTSRVVLRRHDWCRATRRRGGRAAGLLWHAPRWASERNAGRMGRRAATALLS